MALPPTCPLCGEVAASQFRFGRLKHSCCDLVSWDGAPLVSQETMESRQKAHEAFDPLWKTGMFTRSTCYRMLSEMLELPPEQTHMKLMDEATALRVPALVKEILSLIPDACETAT